MSCVIAYSLISGVAGTLRRCNAAEINADGCKTEYIEIETQASVAKIEIPSGQNWLCSCLEDYCNNSPWPEMIKPRTRRSTSPEGLHQTQQHDVTWYSSDTPTANYNDKPTDKITSNGVKALNYDIMFATSLNLLFTIFW